MLKYLFMLIAALVVAAAMVLTLFWFFRRLKAIEKDRWGDKA
jgi:hypothetical protein